LQGDAVIELRAQRIPYHPGLRMDPHVDGCRRLSVVVAGELAESDPRRTEAAGVGSVALKAADFAHHNRFGSEGAVIVSLVLPDAVVTALGCRNDDLCDWRWWHDGDTARTALRLAVAVAREDGATAAVSARELLGRFRRGAGAGPGPEADGAARSAPRGRPAGLARRLQERVGTPVSVTELAAEAGVHPGSLGRAFRRELGCSITGYRQRTRAVAVARTLLRADTPLTRVAQDHAFSDLSHLTRVFRREFGVPPGAFRNALTGRDRRDWRLTA
jgi:AraC-like DNA-binding protein